MGGVNWIRLAQNRERWRAAVNAVMNLRVLVSQSQLLSYLHETYARTSPELKSREQTFFV
jgi:hypothetical protein